MYVLYQYDNIIMIVIKIDLLLDFYYISEIYIYLSILTLQYSCNSE